MLELRLLGIPELTLKNPDETGIEIPYGKALALLAYLVVEHEHWHSRNDLATLLWDSMPDSRAKRNLRQAIYILKHLTPDDGNLLDVEQSRVRLSKDDLIFCDVLSIMMEQEESLSGLETIFGMYRGTFLEGLSLDDCDVYEDWLRLQRSRFQIQAVSIATRLLEAQLLARDYDSARLTAEKFRRIDPTSERAYQYLMRIYAGKGEAGIVREIYEQCETMCHSEYDSVPSEETTQLLQDLLNSKKFESNLPDVDPIIGREHLLDTLASTFRQDGKRLISLVGMGGTGKTHLALSYAHRAIANYDGTFFIPIFEKTTSADLINAIADAMQLSLYREQDSKIQLFNHLKSAHVLLIIDNCEYLNEQHAFLEELLAGTDRVQVLVTSRVALNMDSETMFRLSGLNRDDLDDAIRLFEISARHLIPDFRLTAGNKAQIEAICRQVEGLPLAIILASSWTVAMSVADIASELQASLQILGMAGQTNRIQSVFERSWKLLPEKEQDAFLKLCIFRGYFDRESAQAIAGVDLKVLKTLIDSALVQYSPGERVYSIHELLRQYGEGYLSASPDYKTTRADFRQYYQSQLAGFLSRLRSDEQSGAMSEIEAMFDNLRLMWRFAIEDGDVAIITTTLPVLSRSFELSHRFDEGIALFQEAVDNLPQLPDMTCVQLYETLGTLHHRQSRYEDATGYYERARDMCQAHSPILPAILSGMASTQRRMGEYEKALSLFQQALPLAKQHQDDWQTVLILNGLGGSLAMQGDLDSAQTYFEQSLALARQVGDPHVIATTLGYLGNVYAMAEDAISAEKVYRESLAYYQTSKTLTALASVLSLQGKYDEATGIRNEAIDLCQKTGEDAILAANLSEQAVDYLERGYFEQSLESSSKSYRIRRDIHNRRGQIHSLTQMTFASIYLDRRAEGEQYVGELMKLAEGAPYEMALSLELACLFALQYDSQDFPALLRDFRQTLDAVNYPMGQANYHNYLALNAFQHGDPVLAQTHFEKAIIVDATNRMTCITYSLLCQAMFNPDEVNREKFLVHLESCLKMGRRPELLMLLLAVAYLEWIDIDVDMMTAFILSQRGLPAIVRKVFIGQVETNYTIMDTSPEELLRHIVRFDASDGCD